MISLRAPRPDEGLRRAFQAPATLRSRAPHMPFPYSNPSAAPLWFSSTSRRRSAGGFPFACPDAYRNGVRAALVSDGLYPFHHGLVRALLVGDVVRLRLGSFGDGIRFSALALREVPRVSAGAQP